MTNSQPFPKVLIVAAGPIGDSSGTGLTLANLFKGWPRNRLAQVYTSEHAPDNSFARQFYRVPRSATPIDAVGRAILNRANLSYPGPLIAAVPIADNASFSRRRRADIRALADLSPVLVPPSMNKFVRDFEPDVVYSLLGSARIMRIAAANAKSASAPLVPHFMDDWPSTLYSSGELGGFAAKTRKRLVEQIIREAPAVMCIGDAMVQEYGRRYAVEALPFANPVDCKPGPVPEPVRPLLRATYVGGLHLGRWDSLCQIARAIEAKSLPIELVVHAPERDLAGVLVPEGLNSILHPRGSLTSAQVRFALDDSNFLVHVESFDPEISTYTRLSVSTKLSQYMAAGRPILGYGPTDLASMRLIRDSGAGISTVSETVTAALALFATEASARHDMGKNGYSWALERFETGHVQDRFRRALGSVL